MTRQDLEQVYYLGRELKMWEEELARIRAGSLVASPLPGVSKSSGVSDKVGRRGDHTVELERLIKKRRDELLGMHGDVVRYIQDIPDSLTRQIVHCRCVKLMTWRRVAAEVGGANTEDSVKKRFYRYLDGA